MRYFTADCYGKSHRVADDPTLAVCGRPIPDDATYHTVIEPPKGGCARCADFKKPDYTLPLPGWPTEISRPGPDNQTTGDERVGHVQVGGNRGGRSSPPQLSQPRGRAVSH